MSYEEFLAQKVATDAPTGFPVSDAELGRGGDLDLFPFQKVIVRWAIQRGRAAIFADTGLGKTAMQASWAWNVFQHTGNRVLILAPLCVAPQTVAEAARFGIPIQYVRDFQADGSTGIYITNYEMLDRFEPWIKKGYFDGVVLDESSIIKNQNGKTRKRLIEVCSSIPYRLTCTATPSPNDYTEIGNQAEFLGVMGMPEMLAMFFIRDSAIRASGGGEWRLKGHGKTRFWEWLSHWAVFIRNPSDLGFNGDGYNLPGLEIIEHVVKTSEKPVIAQTLSERNAARRETIDLRVAKAAELANASSEPFLIWCNLNDESSKLAASVTGSLEVRGSQETDEKEENILAFTKGDARCLITKPSITGQGMNWQHCSEMAFVGLNDSYEQLYQAIRRCYRFGQAKTVRVHLISADREGAVLENIKRKERQADEMAQAMIDHMREFSKREVVQMRRQKGAYERDVAKGEDFEVHLSDCVDMARELADESIDYSVFSPPFASLFTYSDLDRDMGNCRNHQEFWTHFEFLVKELLRVLRSGRLISVHCCNLTATKTSDGYMGIKGFRDELVRLFRRVGFIQHSELVIWKDPVVEMQRTKALGLLWKQIRKDSSLNRQGMADYVVTFRKPGENTKPISHTADEFPVRLWQHLASPCWTDIRQGNTLNRKLAREESDERHICPLQLDLIERLLFLWSSPGDLVFSPFTGIGSEGYVATTMGRRFIGSELKRSYFEIAKANLESAPRSGYRFPRFSQKVGGWSPDDPVTQSAAEESPEAEGCDQLDWMKEIERSSQVCAPN